MINSRMWIRATFTLLIFGSFAYILGLLFSSDRTLDDKFRDLLNIIVGSFLVSYGKVIDFWFKKEIDE